MKNKQTAVDWFYDIIKSHFEHDGELAESVRFAYEQAKEKERIIINKAINFGYDCEAGVIKRDYFKYRDRYEQFLTESEII